MRIVLLEKGKVLKHGDLNAVAVIFLIVTETDFVAVKLLCIGGYSVFCRKIIICENHADSGIVNPLAVGNILQR